MRASVGVAIGLLLGFEVHVEGLDRKKGSLDP